MPQRHPSLTYTQCSKVAFPRAINFPRDIAHKVTGLTSHYRGAKTIHTFQARVVVTSFSGFQAETA